VTDGRRAEGGETGAFAAPGGRPLGRYRVRARVGAGGFARVYRAEDPELEMDVALKVLKAELAAEPATVERFRREASMAAKLRHPNVVTVLTVGRLEEPFDHAPVGTPYLVMDYLPTSLGGRLRERGALPEADVVRIGEDVARGLGYAHERDVVHRDVKPDNVLFSPDGRALVSDFGIARAGDALPSTASRQVVLGTPSYFSPEQARGLPLDGRSDLYSLGITLYEASTGTLPFAGDDWYDVMRQHVEAEPPPPRERAPLLSPAFEAVILRCLAKEPGDRFQTGGELADALGALRLRGAEAATIAVPPLPAGVPRRAPSGRPARRRWPALLALVGAGAAGAAGWFALSEGGQATRARLAPGAVRPIDTVAAVVAPDTALTARGDSVRVTPAPATLAVVAPPNAFVQLDGQTAIRGESGWRWDSLQPGPHVVRASLPNSLPGCPTAQERQPLTLRAGEQRTVRLRLLGPCGELGLNVSPTPARFVLTPFRAGVTVREGTLPLSERLVLPEGLYRLTVRRPLCAEYSVDSVQVEPGASATLRIPLIC
jgi:serine/threonine-protein kinase